MKALKMYIDHKNIINALFGESNVLDTNNLTHQQIVKLLDSVDNELSPENLTCDGELPRAKVIAKQKHLLQVQKELLALA